MQDNLNVQVKVVITTSDEKDAPAFGKGAVLLLQGVKELGSLNKSAKRLHMAYSKAWKMVSKLEESLGFDLLERHGSAGSIVTEKGNDLLERYNAIESSITAYAVDKFETLVSEPWKADRLAQED